MKAMTLLELQLHSPLEATYYEQLAKATCKGSLKGQLARAACMGSLQWEYCKGSLQWEYCKGSL
jgi:hypothetical protein